MLVLLWALTACSDSDAGPTASFDTEGWIDTGPGQQPQPPGTGGGEWGEDEGDEEGEEEGGDEGVEEDANECGIFVAWDGSNIGDERFGECYVASAGQVQCAVTFSVELLGDASGCAECAHAWRFRFGDPEIEEETDGGCQSSGALAVAGTEVALGIPDGGGALYRELDGAWQAVGESWIEEGELGMEWFNE